MVEWGYLLESLLELFKGFLIWGPGLEKLIEECPVDTRSRHPVILGHGEYRLKPWAFSDYVLYFPWVDEPTEFLPGIFFKEGT